MKRAQQGKRREVEEETRRTHRIRTLGFVWWFCGGQGTEEPGRGRGRCTMLPLKYFNF